METTTFDWSCKNTWIQSGKNTAWCLLGCAIGDFGTILFFQLTEIPFPVLGIMILAIINGLITSVMLETFILLRQNISFNNALKTALGMSFIAMVSMEIAMNLTDYLFTGGAISNTQRTTGVDVAGMLRTFGIDNPFGRKQESEADYLGLIFSSLAGYDIRESVKIWERMKEENKGKEPPEWMSTHPSSDKRIALLTKWIPEIILKYPPLKAS